MNWGLISNIVDFLINLWGEDEPQRHRGHREKMHVFCLRS